MKFQRSLGPIGLMFTAVSGVLGSAWLFGPYYAVQIAGPAALLSWILGALATWMIALTFAELSCMFPVAGGSARFVYLTHGVLTSFIFSWIMWLGYAAVAPAETLGVILYMASTWPWLVTVKDGVAVLSSAGYGVAALVLMLMCIINFLSIRWLARYNAVMVWIKMSVPVIVAVIVLSVMFKPVNFTQFGGFMPYGFKGVASALSLGGVIFSYAGYAPAIILAGEAKNPQKVIPIVLTGALLICFVIYFILQVAFIGAQAPANVSGGWKDLHFASDASPFVGIADQLGMSKLHYLILITAILTPLGTAIIFIATSARVAYAMSQNGYFPHAMLYLNKKGVPVLAVLLNFLVGMVLFFPAPGWQGMTGFLVAAFVLCYALGPISLIALRSQLPEQARPFRLPWAKAWALISFYIANLIIYWAGWQTYSLMGAAIAFGVVLLVIVRVFQRKQIAMDGKNSIWAFAYLIGMAILSYLGNFGGGKAILAVDWDAVIIFLFSIVIFYWAWQSRITSEKTVHYIKALDEK